MKLKLMIGAALSLACISAAEAPSNYRTYGGSSLDRDPVLLSAYDNALSRCVPEAMTPPRGTPHTNSLHYNAALRSCLYRQGYVDRGVSAYPATLVFDNFFDR
ncbi:hypothetical protein EPK99_18210 [Neorhizobium lilium]|uniref:Uncharacterized protein n=1 Tax=Neorhizobium lilium TaxID=2503024 RepID=A0A3S3RH04_9HYPH|nr:hypothetical protein [Neorhizobium lilium]RWX75630.1 hypothetical protein EPK99_18210 [Neorhizobium lilium]